MLLAAVLAHCNSSCRAIQGGEPVAGSETVVLRIPLCRWQFQVVSYSCQLPPATVIRAAFLQTVRLCAGVRSLT